MKKLFAALLVISTAFFFTPSQAQAAGVAFDATAAGPNSVSAGGTAYYTITVAAGATAVCVANLGAVSATDSTTNVQIGTGAGTSTATKIGGAQAPSDRLADLWCLQNLPTTGKLTIGVTYTTFLTSYATSYTGTNKIDAGATNTSASNTTFTLTAVTTRPNAWLVSTSHSGACSALGAGTGTTARQNTAGQCFAVGDSNAAIVSAGSASMVWTASPTGTWGGVIAALEPPAAATFGPWQFFLF